jgi:TldD protein
MAGSRVLYAPTDPIATLDSAQKVALLEKVEQMARAKDPRVVQVMAGLGAEYDVVLVARADGTRAADVRPLVRLNVTVIAEQNGRREVGSGRRRRPLRPGLLPGRGAQATSTRPSTPR